MAGLAEPCAWSGLFCPLYFSLNVFLTTSLPHLPLYPSCCKDLMPVTGETRVCIRGWGVTYGREWGSLENGVPKTSYWGAWREANEGSVQLQLDSVVQPVCLVGVRASPTNQVCRGCACAFTQNSSWTSW